MLKTTPLVKALVAAGYWDRIDIRRLLADLQPHGCPDLKARTLSNYLTGKSPVPHHVMLAIQSLTNQI